eukprot:TRINITY_DN4353_c0_g1_i10.p1 TRINITY_DN4353_c0_g1~~TRINITY_DN4353_c0_g1_i10.p1  ORF type:complete len:185 (-),score=0.28 TRINITY_DN4353_c0_g1_i10:41-595(-)
MHPIQCNSAHSAVWPGMDEFKLWWTAAAAFVSSSSYSCYRTIAFIWDHVLRVLAQFLTRPLRAHGLLGAVLPGLLKGSESGVVMFIFVVLAVEWVGVEAANYWGYTGLFLRKSSLSSDPVPVVCHGQWLLLCLGHLLLHLQDGRPFISARFSSHWRVSARQSGNTDGECDLSRYTSLCRSMPPW